MARYDAAFRRKHQLYLSILKEFGFGQRAMETRINAEVAELIHQIRQTEGRPFDPSSTITHYVTNVITGIIFGRRYEFGDPAIERLIDHHTTLLKDFVPEVGLWPALRFLPAISRRIRSAMQAFTTLLKDMDEEVCVYSFFRQHYHIKNQIIYRSGKNIKVNLKVDAELTNSIIVIELLNCYKVIIIQHFRQAVSSSLYFKLTADYFFLPSSILIFHVTSFKNYNINGGLLLRRPFG
jgi:hypothetical protein